MTHFSSRTLLSLRSRLRSLRKVVPRSSSAGSTEAPSSHLGIATRVFPFSFCPPMNQLANPLARLPNVPIPPLGPELSVLPRPLPSARAASCAWSVCLDALALRFPTLFAPRSIPFARVEALGFICGLALRELSSESLASSSSDGRLQMGGRKYELACKSADRSEGERIADAKLGRAGTGGTVELDAFGVWGGDEIACDDRIRDGVVEGGYNVDVEVEAEWVEYCECLWGDS